MHFFIYPSIFSSLSGVGFPEQQPKQGSLDLPDIVSPVLGLLGGSPPGGACPDHLTGEAIGRHAN